jgi:CDP-Glycerol:Poly(glycerophosphate) glycerophosphotransferase
MSATMSALRRGSVALARRADHAIGRIFSRPRVLVDARTPMNLAVLAPVWRALIADPGITVCFTHPDRTDIRQALDEAGLQSCVVARPQAAFQRWDLYINADPWDAATLWRCRRRINFFHGVAGKYDLECPTGLPLGLSRYDRIAFPNAGRMQRYVAAGLVTAERAALVGFPKLDALVNAQVPARAKASALGLDGSVKTAIYAPTFSPAASLQMHGEEIVRCLLQKGLNVIVKLHDRSLDPDPAYSGGVDWRARFAAFEGSGRFLFASHGDSTEYLLAADVMVTDHSTIGFEFCALDRPLVVFDVPGLLIAARVDPHKAQVLRSAADVVATTAELGDAVERALADPERRTVERREAVSEVFYDPGQATARALDLCYALLESSGAAAPAGITAWPERR